MGFSNWLSCHEWAGLGGKEESSKKITALKVSYLLVCPEDEDAAIIVPMRESRVLPSSPFPNQRVISR